MLKVSDANQTLKLFFAEPLLITMQVTVVIRTQISAYVENVQNVNRIKIMILMLNWRQNCLMQSVSCVLYFVIRFRRFIVGNRL